MFKAKFKDHASDAELPWTKVGLSTVSAVLPALPAAKLGELTTASKQAIADTGSVGVTVMDEMMKSPESTTTRPSSESAR